MNSASLKADAEHARALGVNPRAEHVAHSVLILSRHVHELQSQCEALSRRVEELEAERPQSLPGSLFLRLARLLG